MSLQIAPVHKLQFSSHNYDYPKTFVLIVPGIGKVMRTNRHPDVLARLYRSSWLNPRYLQGKKVLDLGCGSEGLLVKKLRQQGIETYGIDYDQEYLGMRTPPHCIVGDARKMPFN